MDVLELDSSLLPAGCTLLHIAAKNRDTSQLSSILLSSQQLQLQNVVNKPDSHGRTPLSVALQFGRAEAAVLLIREGADLSCKSSNTSDVTLAEVLERPVYQPLLETLVKGKVKLALNSSLLSKVLHLAVQVRDEVLLRALLRDYEVEVDAMDHLGFSALHYASLAGLTSIARLLLVYGASMTLQDSSGRTALHIASTNGDIHLLDLFLQSELAVPEPDKVLNLLDLSGRTCAHVALYCKQYEALSYLLNHFRDYLDLEACDSNGHTLPGLLFYFRIQLNLIPCTAWLSLPLLSAEESTWALHHAVNRGDMSLVLHSLESEKADLDSFDFMNLSPLMWASKLGNIEICRALVEAGAEINLADDFGITALHCACNNDHFDIAEYFFSLHGVDPTLFFDTFSRPLSPCLLEIILSYFRNSVSVQKPVHWQKWLSLAARNPQMTQEELSLLVNMICPPNWVQLLTKGDYVCSPTHSKEQNPSYISSYIEEWTENPIQNSSRSASLKDFKKKFLPRVILPRDTKERHLSCAMGGGSKVNCNIVMSFKTTMSKRSKKNQRSLKGKGPIVYYPVHEAALCGNVSVVDFFFGCTGAESRNLLTLLMFELKNECKRTVVELMAEKSSVFAQRLDRSVVDEIKMRRKFALPTSMTYEQALMHYLMVYNKPDVGLQPRHFGSNTPLDNWPPWFRKLVFLHHITETGLQTGIADAMDDPLLLSLEQRQSLMTELLDRYGLPSEQTYFSVGYISLLCAAVRFKCVWGVEILVNFGASSLVCCEELQSHIWCPLSEAIRTCQTDMLDFLFQEDVYESMSTACLEVLCFALVVLAARGHYSWTQKLYSAIVCKYANTLWTSTLGPRLIYLSLSHGWLSLVSLLTKDMIAAVCHRFVPGSSDLQLAYVPMMRCFTMMACMYSRPFQNDDNKEIQLCLGIFDSFLKLKCHEELFFNTLCTTGMYDHIQYVLDIVSTSVLEKLFLTLHHFRSPLFCAAVHGHMDVVRLLVERGCPVIHPSPMAYSELIGLLQLDSNLSSLYFDEFELRHGRYNPDIVQFFGVECDFNHIVNSTDYFWILLSAALLPKLDIAHPILKSLLDHLEPSNAYTCDLNNEGTTLGVNCEEVLERAAASLRSKVFQDDSSVFFSNVQNRSATVIRVLCKPSASSQESLHLMDAIMSRIITWELEDDLVCTACERGLWLVVQSSLPNVSHNDKMIVHILNCALKQHRQDCFSLICTTLREEGRLFNEGLPKLLSAAVRFKNPNAVELLLELGGKNVDLVPPLSLAVVSHLHPLVDMFLNKMAAESSITCPTRLNRVLQVAVRHKNHYIITKLMTMMTDYLSLSLPETKASFWFVVLTEAVRCGHEDLALQAISNMSCSQLQQIQKDEYIQMLCWCCSWGMTDVLNCLPITIHMLLTHILSTSEGVKVESGTSYGNISPWCCAEANGNVGKLSHLDSLDLTQLPLASTERGAWFLSLGVFSKFVAGNRRSEASHNINWYPGYCEQMVLREAHFGTTEKLVTFFEHLGTFKKSHFETLCKRFGCINYFPDLLLAACSRRNNFPAVQLILKYLADSGLDLSDHPKVKRCLVHSIRLGEVGYVQALVLYIPRIFLIMEEFDLLTNAILSKNSEMVNYFLDHLRDYSPDHCLQEGHPKNPLCMALALGCSSVVLNSSLASVMLKVKEFKVSSWKYVSSCTGWFSLMMENNARAISSSGDPNVQSSSSFDISPFQMSLKQKMDSKHMMLSLLHASTTHQNHSMTEAIIQASGGIISLKENKKMFEVVAEILLDETVHNFMKSRCYCKEILRPFKSKAKDSNVVHSVLKKFLSCCGCEDKTIRLLELFHPLSMESNTYKYVLGLSCELGRSQVVKHLLSGSDFGEETTSVLQSGLATAVANGHYGLAADIMLKLNITKIEVDESHGPLSYLIFSNPNYFSILDKFFASLNDPTQRMPLATLWLIYDWSEGEAKLVVSELGSMYAPPNPWLLPLDKGDLTITIDWDSFSESLLASPGSVVGHNSSGHSLYVPLVVEATVFTQAVLGQLVPSSFTSGKAFQNPMDADFLLMIECLSSVILTCTVWPATPSFSSFGAAHGILTVSYQPNTMSFVFPDVMPASSKASDKLEETVSASRIVAEKFDSLSQYYEKKVQTLVRDPCQAKVNVSDDLIHEIIRSLEDDGAKSFDLYYTLASAVLQDILDALKLTLLQKSPPPSFGLAQNVTSSVEIFLDCKSDEGDQSVADISFKNSVLSIITFLPCGEFCLETSELCERSFYNNLVDDTKEVILREQVFLAQHDSKFKMEKMVASLLFKSLKLASMPTVTVNIKPEDVIGKVINANNPSLAVARDLVMYVKHVNRLQMYLKYFCRMLKDLQHLPELHTSLCTLFEGCFHVILSRCGTDPIFEVNQGRKQLVVPVESLHTKKRLCNSLLHTLRRLMSTFTSSENPSSSYQVVLSPSITAPTACHVDYHESQGLLFPVRGTRGTITVQMLNYNGDHVKDYLSGTAILKVRIKHLKSKSTLEGFSSNASNGDGKRLLVRDDSNGTFVIKWTPQNVGLHSICLCINGISIEGSPHRCFCADYDTNAVDTGSEGLMKVTDGKAAVFVVAHLGECPTTCKPLPITLFTKKPIRSHNSPPKPVCQESFIRELLNVSGLIHHISLSSAFSGSRNQTHLVDGTVSIHVLSRDRIQNSSFRVNVVPLANGLHYVSVASTITGSFSLFASCTFCQSLMKIHWKSEHSVFLTSLSITHGRIAPLCSTISLHCPETTNGQ